MKKSFLATPKKLLLATSILAMSSTAIAATPALNTAVTDTLVVTANFVKLLTVSIDVTSIDFGDVYSNSSAASTTVSTESVVASIAGEVGETFSYTVSSANTSNSAIVFTGDITGEGTEFAGETGAIDLTFTVGLDTSKLTANEDINENVVVSVTYDDINNTNTVLTI
jgi:hypothetical protein